MSAGHAEEARPADAGVTCPVLPKRTQKIDGVLSFLMCQDFLTFDFPILFKWSLTKKNIIATYFIANRRVTDLWVSVIFV